MTYEDYNHVAGAIQSVATTIALLIGGWWAYMRFWREREGHAHIEFTADIRFVEQRPNCWVVELISNVENKGRVQQRITKFEFDLYCLSVNDPVNTAEQYGGQVLFPHLVAKGSWRPDSMEYFFLEPGVSGKYSYIARVPANATSIILHSWFDYGDGRHSHTAECTVACPRALPNMAMQTDPQKDARG